MEIDVRHLLREIIKRWWIIAMVGILAGILAIGITYFFITPTYSATAKIYVISNPERESTQTQSDTTTSKAMVPSYIEILKSNDVRQEVVKQLNENGFNNRYDAEDIRQMISFSRVTDTEIFKITVKGKRQNDVAVIANTMFEVSKVVLKDITQAGDVKMVETAIRPDQRSAPSYRTNTMVGGIVGGLLSVIIILLVALFDTRVKSEEDLRQTSSLPIFGIIPTYDPAEKAKGKGYYYSHKDDAEGGKEETK